MSIYEQWVIAVEDCECNLQDWKERWPRVLDIVNVHFTCGLMTPETDIMITALQIGLLYP